MILTQVVLRLGEHAAGSAGGVQELAHRAGGREKVVVIDEENVHHEPNDLARREVIARGLIGKFIEAADQVLEDEPHLLVGDAVWVQVDIGELRDDEIEDVRLAHLLDLGLKLKVLEDAAHVGRESVDVADQVFGNMVWVGLELLEGKSRVVVEALASRLVEQVLEGVAFNLAALSPLVGSRGPCSW